MITPAPSPSTNPSRPLSNGREARSGSSFLVDMAPHHRERADVECHDRGLGAAGDHHVGPPGADHVDAVADRLGTGRARAHQRVRPGLGAELDADPAGRAVRHQHRDGVGRDALPALLAQRVVGGEGGADAADAAGDRDAEPVRLDLGRPGVGPGLAGRDQRELLAPVHLARLHPADDGHRVDRGGARRTSPAPSRSTGSVMVRTPLVPASIADQVDATSPPSGVVAPSPVTTTLT